jgi:hypothetical protein
MRSSVEPIRAEARHVMFLATVVGNRGALLELRLWAGVAEW